MDDLGNEVNVSNFFIRQPRDSPPSHGRRAAYSHLSAVISARSTTRWE